MAQAGLYKTMESVQAAGEAAAGLSRTVGALASLVERTSVLVCLPWWLQMYHLFFKKIIYFFCQVFMREY